MTWLRWALALCGVLVAWQLVHGWLAMKWSDARTDNGQYFAWNRLARRGFHQRIHAHATLLSPLLWLMSVLGKYSFVRGTFRVRGVPGPEGACTEASFRRGMDYAARPEDVYIVTQMKCGTTWMQYLVFQLVTAGKQDLADTGEALYGLSPWLESCKTLPVTAAKLIGEQRPTRLIKTHFPANVCPWHERAKYIYVARHPVSCFASCVDFIRSNLGRISPSLEACEEWFCSDQLMWWTPWPDHVSGWWQRAQELPNVLFVRFEDMKQDLASVARQVEQFLELTPLSDDELAKVLQRCSFASMRDNYDLFEMQAPHLLQDAPSFFASGKVDRFRDIDPEMNFRIIEWCRARLATEPRGVSMLYDELAEELEELAV
ncbi:MAG: sulfotransferase domain-containing protein [Planctomycetales bacterium]|nr:sulfotransferase domain-containing protein [Planctomycetales bacterium]